MENMWNNAIAPIDWEKKHEFPQARDLLIHFNKTFYPEIEQKYHPEKWKASDFTKKSISKLFGWKYVPTERSYKELWIQTAQGITNLILWDYPTDPVRIKLLLESMWLDMISVAYCNVYLDYSYAADRYAEQGEELKHEIIKECLKICDKKFRWRVATLTLTDELIILNSRHGGTVIHNKKDFLNKK